MEDRIFFAVTEKGTDRFRGVFRDNEMNLVARAFLGKDNFDNEFYSYEDFAKIDWANGDLDMFDMFMSRNGYELHIYDVEDFV